MVAALSPDDAIQTISRECLAVRVRMLNRLITGIYEESMRPIGVTASQFNILVLTGVLEVARPAVVCRRLHLDASTLSRNLDRMYAQGWIETVPDSDGRTQPFRLTSAGKCLIADAFPLWEKAQHEAADLMGESAVRSIHALARQSWSSIK